MKVSFILIITAIYTFIASCSPIPKSATSSSGSSQLSKGTGGNQKTGGKGEGSSDEEGGSGEDESGVPDFQSADLGKNFNRNDSKLLNFKTGADKDKVFLVQRVKYYRPIWLNLSKPVSGGFWKFWGNLTDSMAKSPVASWAKSSFPSFTVKTDKVSIYQPLASIAGSDDLATSAERGDHFVTLGHVLSQDLKFPSFPAAVISYFLNGPSDPLANSGALAPPSGYVKVHSYSGTLPEELLKACDRVQKKAEKGHAPNQNDLAQCDNLQAGSSSLIDYFSVQNYGSSTTGIGNMSVFYFLQSYAIWDPIPPPGYQCLGQILTDGVNNLDQPQSAADAGGPYALYQQTLSVDQSGDLAQSGVWEMPMYCVKEKYLVEGQLAPIATSGEVDFYAVLSKDSNGYNGSNLFWSTKTSTPDSERKARKVWVLNKNFVKFLPDLNFGAKRR